jgi:hypothetical protein
LFGTLVVTTGLRVVGVGFTATTGVASVVVVTTSVVVVVVVEATGEVVVVSKGAVLDVVSGVALADEQETSRRARIGSVIFLTKP